MTKVYQKNKILFYIQGFSRGLFPAKHSEKVIDSLYKSLSKEQLINVEERASYYNQVDTSFDVKNGTFLKDLLKPKTPKSYYFDALEHTRHFPQNLKLDFAFGDINTILDSPSIAKSRPIHGDNKNNVLLNLDKARHFVSVDDDKKYENKKNILIGRSAVFQLHRLDFYTKYFDHKLCDLGQVNTYGGNLDWVKPKISIEKHLDYKFILSLEGNDVATNLKWIMSSNSVAVSPPLKMETWYMEGKLKPDEHYIGINENYDNLEEKLQYYLDHPNEVKDIITNAKKYRSQFENESVEKLTSLLVLKKYFAYIRTK